MQPFFDTVTDEVVDGVLKEIQLAKRRKAGILVLEYLNCGKTDSRIIQSLENYPYQLTLTKPRDNGSWEVFVALTKPYFNGRKLRICGVNICACILTPIRGVILKWKEKNSDIKLELLEFSFRASNCCTLEKDQWGSYLDNCLSTYLRRNFHHIQISENNDYFRFKIS